MKKTYTKRQITEAIAYWKKQLKMMNESDFEDHNGDMYGNYIASDYDIENVELPQGLKQDIYADWHELCRKFAQEIKYMDRRRGNNPIDGDYMNEFSKKLYSVLVTFSDTLKKMKIV